MYELLYFFNYPLSAYIYYFHPCQGRTNLTYDLTVKLNSSGTGSNKYPPV